MSQKIRAGGAILLFALSACASDYVSKPLSQLFDGSAGAAHVRVEGRMDTSVINAYSLQDGNSSRRGNNCVGLILSDPDRRRAQSLDGQLIEVRGSVMGTGDLNTALPSGYGEINGRAWSGSVCDGRSVIYVKNIRVLLPQN